jgi:hypothetical protein
MSATGFSPSIAEAMGIVIGAKVEREDWYLGSSVGNRQSIAALIIRKNRITLSAGDAMFDADFWRTISRGVDAANMGRVK